MESSMQVKQHELMDSLTGLGCKEPSKGVYIKSVIARKNIVMLKFYGMHKMINHLLM